MYIVFTPTKLTPHEGRLSQRPDNKQAIRQIPQLLM